MPGVVKKWSKLHDCGWYEHVMCFLPQAVCRQLKGCPVEFAAGKGRRTVRAMVCVRVIHKLQTNVQQQIVMEHGLDDVDDVVNVHVGSSAPLEPLGGRRMCLLGEQTTSAPKHGGGEQYVYAATYRPTNPTSQISTCPSVARI